MTRSHGRAPRGRRIACRMQVRTPRYTLIGAIHLQGLLAPKLWGRAMTQKDWEQYVEHDLIPALPPHSILIMDNLNIHKTPKALDLLKKAGVHVFFQSRYSPDFNPIEKVWSKLKALIRGLQPRGAKQLREAVAKACPQITQDDLWGFFNHCLPISPETQRPGPI